MWYGKSSELRRARDRNREGLSDAEKGWLVLGILAFDLAKKKTKPLVLINAYAGDISLD